MFCQIDLDIYNHFSLTYKLNSLSPLFPPQISQGFLSRETLGHQLVSHYLPRLRMYDARYKIQDVV